MFGQKASVQLQTAAGCRYSRPLCAAADRPVRLSPGLIRDAHSSSNRSSREKSVSTAASLTVTEQRAESRDKVPVFRLCLSTGATASSLFTGQ